MPAEHAETPIPFPRVENLFLADFAEAINGKLYAMGGGFSDLNAPAFPFSQRVWLAAMLTIPWEHTNKRFPVSAHLEADGEPLEWRMAGEIEAGRPPGMRSGELRLSIAAPVDIANLPEPANFELKFAFANDLRTVAFRVVAMNIAMAAPPPPAAE